MKISQLTRLDKPNRALEIPLALYGENRNITLGQILDSVPKSIVPFYESKSTPANTVVADTSAASLIGKVVYDTNQHKLYFAVTSVNLGEGVGTTTYYTSWNGSDDFIGSGGSIRKDCLFRDKNGRLYFYDGETLVSAGITEEQAEQIALSTPIEVASEQEMEQRIASGEYVEGQLYFLAED